MIEINSAPLFRYHLLELMQPQEDIDQHIIIKAVQVNQRVMDFLLEHQAIDQTLALLGKLYQPEQSPEDFMLQPEIEKTIKEFSYNYQNQSGKHEPFIFSFFGKDECQKLATAGALCRDLRINLLEIDLAALFRSTTHYNKSLQLLLRESIMLPAALFIKNCDFIFDDAKANQYEKYTFINEIDQFSFLTFLSSPVYLPLEGEFQFQNIISLEFTIPGFTMRQHLWQHYLKNLALGPDFDVNTIANKYNLTRGQIQEIVTAVLATVKCRDPQKAIISQQDIEKASQLISNRNLNNLAKRIKPQKTLADLVIADESLEKIQSLINMCKNRHFVFNNWGFDKKLSLGKGISSLFYGEPGTGKTMTAEIIAYELGIELYTIDISSILSKYIGETEKKLNKIFTEAECCNAILFFDEADAIFGKRSEVHDSHDRYANIEVSYLLQKIDEYPGIILLASNFQQNIDEAFERRLNFFIKFPLPDRFARLKLWQTIFPEQTPLAQDIPFEYLAQTFELSGGNIKNIALNAAFNAVEFKQKTVTIDHIMKACKIEFIKMGRLWDRSYEL